MGRPQIKGIEICPKCGEFGRIRKKNVRSRSTGRYVKRSYFRHNNSSIPEHYIDNFIKRSESKFITEADKLMHSLKRMAQDFDEVHLEADEKKRLVSAFRSTLERVVTAYKMLAIHSMKEFCDRKNITMPKPLENLYNRVTEAENHGRQAQERFNIMWKENPSQAADHLINLYTSDPLFQVGWELYEKYLLPKRLERNKKRNTYLSEWHGRKTNDYTGVLNSICD